MHVYQKQINYYNEAKASGISLTFPVGKETGFHRKEKLLELNFFVRKTFHEM